MRCVSGYCGRPTLAGQRTRRRDGSDLGPGHPRIFDHDFRPSRLLVIHEVATLLAIGLDVGLLVIKSSLDK
jgi:hypothetical protein